MADSPNSSKLILVKPGSPNWLTEVGLTKSGRSFTTQRSYLLS